MIFTYHAALENGLIMHFTKFSSIECATSGILPVTRHGQNAIFEKSSTRYKDLWQPYLWSTCESLSTPGSPCGRGDTCPLQASSSPLRSSAVSSSPPFVSEPAPSSPPASLLPAQPALRPLLEPGLWPEPWLCCGPGPLSWWDWPSPGPTTSAAGGAATFFLRPGFLGPSAAERGLSDAWLWVWDWSSSCSCSLAFSSCTNTSENTIRAQNTGIYSY